MWFTKAGQLFKAAAMKFWWDKAPRLGAALAFYTALSLSPLLLIMIGIAGLVFGAEAARGEIYHQINGLVGVEGAKAIEAMLASDQTHHGGIVATVVGLVTLLVGATGVIAQLQDALDTIWGMPPGQAGAGVWSMVRDRLLSLSVVCGMGFLLLVSLIFSAIISAIGGALNARFPAIWMEVFNAAISLLLTTAMFAIIFKLLPHVRPAWSDVWFGAVTTALLFAVGKTLIGLYLGRAAIGSAYGAAGSFVVLLVWIYYSTQIVLFGAEMTQVYSQRSGRTRRGTDTKPLRAEKAVAEPARR